MKKMFLMLGCLLQLQMQAVNIDLNNYVGRKFRGANNVEVLNNVQTRGTLSDQLDALYPVLSRYIADGVVYKQCNHARLKGGLGDIVVWRRSGDERWNLFRPNHGLIHYNDMISALIDIRPGRIIKVKKAIRDRFGLMEKYNIGKYEYAYMSNASLVALDSKKEFLNAFIRLSDDIWDYDSMHQNRIMGPYTGERGQDNDNLGRYRFIIDRAVIGITARTDSDLVVINTIFD